MVSRERYVFEIKKWLWFWHRLVINKEELLSGIGFTYNYWRELRDPPKVSILLWRVDESSVTAAKTVLISRFEKAIEKQEREREAKKQRERLEKTWLRSVERD